MKALSFTCLLRLSKSQMSENGFKDTVIDSVYGSLLEYLSTQSHIISFPDLSLLCIMQVRKIICDLYETLKSYSFLVFTCILICLKLC